MKEINPMLRKGYLYLLAGGVCSGLGQFVSARANTFTDWEFASGVLLGAAIFAFLHAVYFLGVRIRQLRDQDQKK